MSDAVTNAEVEDVLSSIRRLVSEDKRPVSEVDRTAGRDRLVLTPALRVAEPPAAEPAPEPEVEPEASQEDHEGDTSFVAEDAGLESELSDGAEDATAENQNTEHDFDADEAIIAALTEDTDAQEAEAEMSDPAQDMPVEEARGEVAEDGDADHGAQGDASAEAGSLEAVFDAVTAQSATRHDDQPEDSGAQAEEVSPTEAPQSDAARSLSAKIAVLEEVIGRSEDQWEPDDAGSDDYAGTEPPAMAWEDTAEDGADSAPEPEATWTTETEPEATSTTGPEPEATWTTGTEPELGAFATDEDVLDEDALRDLVADIVRQELQGALGERITRNVRKLVRREIHRALAAQELE